MKKYLIGGVIGATLTMIINLYSLTEQYGRLSNHDFCNMSVENLSTLPEHERSYYLNY